MHSLLPPQSMGIKSEVTAKSAFKPLNLKFSIILSYSSMSHIVLFRMGNLKMPYSFSKAFTRDLASNMVPLTPFHWSGKCFYPHQSIYTFTYNSSFIDYVESPNLLSNLLEIQLQTGYISEEAP